jgi:hypothetical protein
VYNAFAFDHVANAAHRHRQRSHDPPHPEWETDDFAHEHMGTPALTSGR